MDIFWLDLEKIDNSLLDAIAIRDDLLIQNCKSELKQRQHLAGRFLLDFVAKELYFVEDTALILQAQKPIFKNSLLHFSLSHSANIVMLAISEFPVGIDLEQNLKMRDFISISSRFDKEFSENLKALSVEKQQEVFYKFWTRYEAKIKIGTAFSDNAICYNPPFVDGYTVGVASAKAIDNFEFKKWGTL